MGTFSSQHRGLAIAFSVGMIILALTIVMRTKCGCRDSDAEADVEGFIKSNGCGQWPRYPVPPATYMRPSPAGCVRDRGVRCGGWDQTPGSSGGGCGISRSPAKAKTPTKKAPKKAKAGPSPVPASM